MKLPKGVTVEPVHMPPEAVVAQAKREGATLYDNEFAHIFEPWPRHKIQRNIAKLRQGASEDEDAELKEFRVLHPTIAKMVEAGCGGGSNSDRHSAALVQLFEAHDDIMNGRATKNDVMTRLMRGVVADAVGSNCADGPARDSNI
jgi:hypothetical protein